MKLTVNEVKSIPTGGAITRAFSAGNEACSEYVKRVYKRGDGKTYKISTDWKAQTITVKVVDK